MDTNIYWNILLNQWRQEGNDGLSIPFIIGSQKHLLLKKQHEGIRDLIDEIIRSNNGLFYIKYCFNVDAVIIGVWDETKKANAGEFLPYKGNSQSNFFVTKFLVDDWKADLDFGINDLVDRYADFIDSGQYSINQREWRAYGRQDLEFIGRCSIQHKGT